MPGATHNAAVAKLVSLCTVGLAVTLVLAGGLLLTFGYSVAMTAATNYALTAVHDNYQGFLARTVGNPAVWEPFRDSADGVVDGWNFALVISDGIVGVYDVLVPVFWSVYGIVEPAVSELVDAFFARPVTQCIVSELTYLGAKLFPVGTALSRRLMWRMAAFLPEDVLDQLLEELSRAGTIVPDVPGASIPRPDVHLPYACPDESSLVNALARILEVLAKVLTLYIEAFLQVVTTLLRTVATQVAEWLPKGIRLARVVLSLLQGGFADVFASMKEFTEAQQQQVESACRATVVVASNMCRALKTVGASASVIESDLKPVICRLRGAFSDLWGAQPMGTRQPRFGNLWDDAKHAGEHAVHDVEDWGSQAGGAVKRTIHWASGATTALDPGNWYNEASDLAKAGINWVEHPCQGTATCGCLETMCGVLNGGKLCLPISGICFSCDPPQTQDFDTEFNFCWGNPFPSVPSAGEIAESIVGDMRGPIQDRIQQITNEMESDLKAAIQPAIAPIDAAISSITDKFQDAIDQFPAAIQSILSQEFDTFMQQFRDRMGGASGDCDLGFGFDQLTELVDDTGAWDCDAITDSLCTAAGSGSPTVPDFSEFLTRIESWASKVQVTRAALVSFEQAIAAFTSAIAAGEFTSLVTAFTSLFADGSAVLNWIENTADLATELEPMLAAVDSLFADVFVAALPDFGSASPGTKPTCPTNCATGTCPSPPCPPPVSGFDPSGMGVSGANSTLFGAVRTVLGKPYDPAAMAVREGVSTLPTGAAFEAAFRMALNHTADHALLPTFAGMLPGAYLQRVADFLDTAGAVVPPYDWSTHPVPAYRAYVPSAAEARFDRRIQIMVHVQREWAVLSAARHPADAPLSEVFGSALDATVSARAPSSTVLPPRAVDVLRSAVRRAFRENTSAGAGGVFGASDSDGDTCRASLDDPFRCCTSIDDPYSCCRGLPGCIRPFFSMFRLSHVPDLQWMVAASACPAHFGFWDYFQNTAHWLRSGDMLGHDARSWFFCMCMNAAHPMYLYAVVMYTALALYLFGPWLAEVLFTIQLCAVAAHVDTLEEKVEALEIPWNTQHVYGAPV